MDTENQTENTEKPQADPSALLMNDVSETLTAVLSNYPVAVGVSITLLLKDSENESRLTARTITSLPGCDERDAQGIVGLIEQTAHLAHLRTIPNMIERGMRPPPPEGSTDG